VKLSFLLVLVASASLYGCSGGSSASVTAKEEEMFKHPEKVDMSKLPPINFAHKGPAFIGKPSGATGKPDSAPLPAAAITGG